MSKSDKRLADYIYGTLQDQLPLDVKKNVESIFKKTTKDHEFELMFFNYKQNENLMGFENFLKILEYMNYKSKHKSMKLENIISLDVIYQIQHGNNIRDTYRISINGNKNINKYMGMLHMRKNHVIFSTLINMAKTDENISIIKKVKSKEDTYDIDSYDIRVRLSKELPVTKDELKILEKLNESERNFISFRYKQRASLTIYENAGDIIKVDLTTTKMNDNINMVYRSIPNYELEIDFSSTGSPKTTSLDKIYSEATTLLKILQQSNFIIGKDMENEVLNRYADLLGENKDKMTSLAGRRAQSLEVQHIVDKLPNRYAVTDKADGDRCFLIIYNTAVFFISDNLHVKNTGIILANNKFNDSIIDGELIFLPEKNRHVYMAFDCLYSQGKDHRVDPNFMDRLKEVDNIIYNCFVLKGQKGFTFKEYNGSFDTDKIIDFHRKEIDIFMSSVNHDIGVEKLYPLIRRKYFINALGGQDNEIFKYSKLIWDKYVFDKTTNCPYILDGLIYHPLEQPYVVSVKDSKYIEYKWKPPNKNSIDFYIQFEKNPDTGKMYILYDNSDDNAVSGKPYKIANLYVGSSGRTGEVPILFNPEDNRHVAYLFLEDGEVRDQEGNIIQDNTVVEFYYNNDVNIPDKHRWVAMRTRHDKTESVQRYKKKYGNYVDIAKKVWRSISNPITINDISILANDKTFDKHRDVLRGKIEHSVILSEAKENVYYQIRTNLGKPMRNFHNWIKSVLLYTRINPVYERQKHHTVLDIACGRGGDIMKFYYSKVELYVGIDIDNNGIISPTDGAISRYNQLRKTHPNFPRMFFVNADGGALLDYDEQVKVLGTMSTANEKIMKQFFSLDAKQRTQFDRITCIFAIHYFFTNDIIWNNFVQNVNMYLKPGGFMLVITNDGEKVMDRLTDKDQYTSYYTNDKGERKVLFEIVKKYDVKDRTIPFGTGHAIDLFNGLLSNEGDYKTEYLVDKRFLEKEFLEKCSMELVETDLFQNQFNIHEQFFKNTMKYEENPKTRAFFAKAAEFYDQQNEVNKACFDALTSLHRYYVFRKKDDASTTVSKGKQGIASKQKGGNANDETLEEYVDYVMYDAVDYINPSKFIRRELNRRDEFSLHRSIHDVLRNEGIIPKSTNFETFYKDMNYNPIQDENLDEAGLKKLVNNLIIGHNDSDDTEVVLNGINLIVLNKECNGLDISTYCKNGKFNSHIPSIILYNDGTFYNPIYRVKDGKNNGLFDSRMKFVKKIVRDSD